MAEELSIELNNGVFTPILDESEKVSYHFSPDVDSKCLSSRNDARDSGVTSDLDRAVAALEARSSNILEHSETTCLSSERELKCRAVEQDTLAQGRIVSAQQQDDEETKPRGFSELRAMFSQTDTSQNMLSPRKGKLHDFNSPKIRPLESGSIEHEKLSIRDVTNEMQSEGDSMVARMKRSFETTTSSIDTGIEKSPRIYKKPVSFEVGLGDYVTRDSSSIDITHDPSQAQQTKKEVESILSENIIRPESPNTSVVTSPCVENLEQNNEQIKNKETLTGTGIPSDSPKSLSFDISFDDKPCKRVPPKTMPKLPKRKLVDSKTAEVPCSESETLIKLVDEQKQTLESQGERKDFSTSETSIINRSCSFEVSFEDDSPRKTKSHDRLNKLLVKKPCRTTDRPTGEDLTVRCLATCENEQNGHVHDKANGTDNELQVLSPKEQLSTKSERSASGGFDIDLTLTPETTRELVLSTENRKTNERNEMKKTAQAISFDICFDEDSVEKPKLNRKPKLTPKHIRLKKTKEQQQQQQQQPQQEQQQKQQQQNTQNKIETDEVNNATSSFPLSVLPKTSRPDLKEPNERNTYTLDEVSSSLQSACERGLTLEDALDHLAKQQETTEQPGNTDVTSESDEVTSTKRGTYSLDEVATCLVSAADNCLTVAEALDNLAKSEEKEKQITQSYQQDEQNQSSITNTSVKRGTYDLDEVSKKIAVEKDKGNSLEEALIQLLDEVETVVKETQKTSSRGTYDLKDVSEAVEQASEQGIPVEETLEKIATIDDTKTTNRAQLTAAGHEKQTVLKDEEESRELNSRTEIVAGKRGTYSLDDVEKQLEQAADKGSSVVGTLSEISKGKVPETSSSLKINGKESAKIEETVSPTRNTYTLDEVAQSLELAKSKGIPIVEALSNISTERLDKEPAKPGSRETYTLDKVAQSLETAREKGLPIVMALENLVLNGGGSLRGPAEVAVHRRQGKLTNRKTYALASPLETIGEEKQLRLFDGTTRKLLPATKDYLKGPQPQLYDDPENTQPSGQNVVQTLDLLTSACEALLKTTGKKKDPDEIEKEQTSKDVVLSVESRQLREQFKAESRDSGISFPGGPSERGTYSLDEVSETLEGASKKGIPVIDALGSLTAKEPVKKYRIPRALRKAGSKSESSLNMNTTAKQESSRQTYSLDNVSNSMEDAKAKGIPVIAALDELTNSLARFSATRPTPGKPIRKPERPSITRKREAARQERANVRSEIGREAQKPTGSSFPISYPPAMRNSYSLDDVASAFEKAYQTGIPFQDVLEGIHSESDGNVQPSEDPDITRSTGSLKMGKDYLQSTTVSGDYSRKTQSASSLTKVNEFSTPAESNSSLDGKSSSPPRKSSTSSEGSLTCSSSYGSDVSVNRDSSSTEELPHVSKVSSVRRQRKRLNGPFQLKKGGRRNSPANLRQLNTSPSSLQGNSLESLASRDSEQSDSSQTKRGTYDLKKIGEELDRFKVEGIPVVQGLDKLVTDVGTVGKAKSEETINTQVTPKRGTYSLDDVSQQLDSEKHKGDSVIRALNTLSSKPAESQSDSQPSASENKTRNTFTLDHVDVSIADAARRGVPVVEALDKLSHEEISGELQKTETSKRNREPFAKTGDNSFFVEYFPSKTEEEAQKNGAPVYVREGPVWEHRDLDNYPTRDGSAKQKGDEIVCKTIDVRQSVGTDKTQVKERTQLISPPITTSDVPELHKSVLISSECDSQILGHSRVAEQSSLEIESKREDPASQTQVSPEQKSNEDEVLVAGSTRTRPRWQRSGSYVEALESFEELLASDQDLSSPEALDSIPVKESDYLNGNYDTMYPETASSETSNTSPRGRSTWRPSGSVLDEILSLMDEHEEQGLSIADALEKAAELSEQQGLFL